jgi:multiple sugar transport system ATP-binding protein
LRLIAGLEQLDEGELRIGGRKVNDVAPRDRDVAMVFQSYALYPHMTVRENLAFGLTLRKVAKAEVEARVAEAAALLELTPLLDRRPKALSGGQRQRVAMGRAIVRRPKIFLFDEPLSNLDTALRVQMRGELARLHRKLAATMIYVTHDQVEAMTLATRVAVFNAGVLQQLGAPLELYNRPANRFVAGFLGSPSMNFFTARRESSALVGKGFSLPLPAGIPSSGGSEVLVGLRPQDLRVAANGPFKGQVEAVERLGFDGYAFLSTESGPLAARFEGAHDLQVGQQVRVAPAADGLHVFSADGSTALRHPADRTALEAAS